MPGELLPPLDLLAIGGPLIEAGHDVKLVNADVDPDQVMSIYATPHRWTLFYSDAKCHDAIQPDLRRWDYKHQVMRVPRVPAWRVFLWVKVIELVLQLRPRALWRNWLHPDPEIRHAMLWYTRMGRGVILSELADIL